MQKEIRTVYGFPTTGKSTLIESIKKDRFVRITDTDLLFPAFRDDWFDQGFYRGENQKDKDHNKLVSDSVSRLAEYLININKTDILITNLWYKTIKLDIGFVRTNVDDIIHFSKVRGGHPFSKELVEGWVSGLKPERLLQFLKGYVILERNEYIGTFLRYVKESKRLTYIGKSDRIITS